MLVGETRTNDKGEFKFTGLPAGDFVVETVAPNGTLLGTSPRIALAAGKSSSDRERRTMGSGRFSEPTDSSNAWKPTRIGTAASTSGSL